VESVKNYGRLSGRGFQPVSGARAAVGATGKRHPADFVLWRTAKPREPSWSSPWGPGRPGWHIECSAMSTSFFGEMFDIHGGGCDLIFPHHENEIAQSECLFQKNPASYWIHNGLVHGSDGRKMSKSSDNFVNIGELLDVYSPDAVRLFFLSKRYRHPMEFSLNRMEAAAKNMGRLTAVFTSPDDPRLANPIEKTPRGRIWSCFCEAMEDDFNFPNALAVIFQSVRTLNRARAKVSTHRLPDITASISDLWFICRHILGFNLPLHPQ
jgi:cysteinyl-tRNA synthetase